MKDGEENHRMGKEKREGGGVAEKKEEKEKEK